jgi:hypothetical protein
MPECKPTPYPCPPAGPAAQERVSPPVAGRVSEEGRSHLAREFRRAAAVLRMAVGALEPRHLGREFYTAVVEAEPEAVCTLLCESRSVAKALDEIAAAFERTG